MNGNSSLGVRSHHAMRPLHCQAAVLRMGELFGEFGINFNNGSVTEQELEGVERWRLFIYTLEDITSPVHLYDDVGTERAAEAATQAASASDVFLPLAETDPRVMCDDLVEAPKTRKVVKLAAGSQYVVGVQYYHKPSMTWSKWSPPARVATFHPIVTKIDDIGEDWVRVSWERSAPRDTTGITPEEDSISTKRIGDIAGFEVRVLRERDMVEEFRQRFDSGVRTHTLHGLRPGTAHIVMIRHETLIGTVVNWLTVARFFTEEALVAVVGTRGEDAFTVTWRRGERARDVVGYIVPRIKPHVYGVTVEGDGLQFEPIELPASVTSYRMQGLLQSTTYAVYVRCLSKEGRWGAKSNTLQVRTADQPVVAVTCVCEPYLSFSWSRPVEEDREEKLEYMVKTNALTAVAAASTYQCQELVDVRRIMLKGSSEGEPEREVPDRQFHLDGLSAGTEYLVSIRTFVDGEWGLWTTPAPFSTQPKAVLSCIERGEDFFTLRWPTPDGNDGVTSVPPSSTDLFNVVVTLISPLGGRSVVLDRGVTADPGQPGFRVGHLTADSVYEVKSRMWQRNHVTGNETWGEFTHPLRLQTLEPVALTVWDIGEDFAHVVWRKDLDKGTAKAPGAHTSTAEDVSWGPVQYEVVVGCMDTGDDDILHRHVTEANYTITNLRPSTVYVVSVRACDERGQWGLWSKLRMRTLASIVTTIHEIGEDFVRLMWQRRTIDGDDHADGGGEVASAGDAVTSADMFISRYSVFVYSAEMLESDIAPDELSGYSAGGRVDVARRAMVSSDHTSLRVGELLPDREYVAVVRASTASGQWGLWSRPVHFRSNPQFCIPVNNLSIGENYVSLVWSRDTQPVLSSPDVQLGDMTVTGQELRIHGVDTHYSKDHTLDAGLRELKLYGLSPASAYTIQLRVRGRSGCWGLWSPPVHILTRGTMLTSAVEVAEDYAIISWERRRVPNPSNHPTGRGVITSYHLRVYNSTIGVHLETFLGDSDCPYRVSDLRPDTYYCVELKAHYNDEEWGLWSTPLWYLTMQPMKLHTQLISEEFCRLSVVRPTQQRRLPEDDGNRPSKDKLVAFGQLRPTLMLCVTSPLLTKNPHTSSGFTKPKQHNSSLPPDTADHRLIYQTEIISSSEVTEHAIPNLKSNTVYSVSARSKLPNGEWGMWAPSLLFATVPTTCAVFRDIGENFIRVEWRRHAQLIPPHIAHPEDVACGLGTISASRVRVREVGGSYQRLYSIETSVKTLRLDELAPATTYGVSVQTYNDNFDWGVWSEESKVRTVPGMDINVQHVSEDALWVSWTRLTDLDAITDADTTLSVNVVARSYEVRISGAGHFRYSKETDSNKLYFRGLQPDTVYTVEVRVLFAETGEWGLWSSRDFRTKPRLRVTFGSIGEHFAIVEWRRHLPVALEGGGAAKASEPIADTEDVVERYRFKVRRVGDEVGQLYDLAPTVNSFRLKNLLPSSEYRVWMCAKGYEDVWGFWNEETRVRTLPKLTLGVVDIGEDYVRVRWQRDTWVGEAMPDDGVEVRQVDGAVSGYQLRVRGRDDEVVSTQAVSFRETSCVVSGLHLSTLYSIEVSAKDTYEEWGLWSDQRRFVTLKAVEVNLLRVGEAFMDVEWYRLGTARIRHHHHHLGHVGSGGHEETRELEESSASDQSALHPYYKNLNVGVLEDSIPPDALREDDTATQWHVRLQAKRIFGGQPGAEDYREFFADPQEDWRRIENLLPNSTYAVSVRARNKAEEWGHWSPQMLVATYPLLQVRVDAVAETFINLSWARGERSEQSDDDSDSNDLVHTDSLICFPERTDIHNYQVTIRPLSSEEPFDEEDEPLVDGARVYETTQPSLRLGNLTPGTRYVTTVREQHVDDSGRAVEGSWGTSSEVTFLETTPPLRVIPVEMGEDYCFVEWRRVQRAAEEGNTQLSVSTRSQRVGEYEIHTRQLKDDGATPCDSQLAHDKQTTLPPSVQSFHIDNLLHSTIYEVRVRARGDSGSWGPWSPVTKFMTYGRLQITVDSVFETNMVLSWMRPLPVWAMQLQQEREAECVSPIALPTALPPYSEEHNTDSPIIRSTTAVSDKGDSTAADGEAKANGGDGQEDEVKDDEDDVRAASPLDNVFLGSSTVQRYELAVKGVSCEFDQSLIISKDESSATVGGLEQNQLYWVSVRSLSDNGHWSRRSNQQSVLTLNPMAAYIAHYTESAAVVRWRRAPSDAMRFADLLATERVAVEHRCDEQEKRDLYDLKRKMQELEAEGESVNEGWLDQAARAEHNALIKQESIHHLLPENVVLGDTDNSAYHLRLSVQDEDSVCCPFVHCVEQLRMRAPPPAKLFESSVLTGMSGGPGKRATRKNGNTSMYTTVSDGTAMGAVGFTSASGLPGLDELAAISDGTLIDVQLQEGVREVLILNLRPSSGFRVTVCSRNTRDEWQPWSAEANLQTLAPITLCQSRFGEHYINLYWHRMDADTTATMDRETAEYQALSDEFKSFTHKELEGKKETMAADEYATLLDQLRTWRDMKLAVQERRQAMADGKVPLIVDPNTPIVGYQLRIVLEGGAYTDHYITSEEAGAAFTATGLRPNHMYVCLVCAHYGRDLWGQWTKPLKFMTQNLIQLQLTYVGEAFVDIEWQRMENKRLPLLDRDALTASTFSEEEQIYQVRITHVDPANPTGETVEECRDMKTCNSFRVDRLKPDTKYTFGVREWDAKGDWGLWCTPRTCATLPGMFTVLEDVGEDWAKVSWGRLDRCVNYDSDMHVLQNGVETVACFLRVEELADNGDEAAAECEEVLEQKGQRCDALAPAVVAEDEMEGIFAEAQRRAGSGLPNEHPQEFEGTGKDGRYTLVRKFDPLVARFELSGLKPNRFYTVEILSETTGEQLGMWSAPQILLTMPKIMLSVEWIDELYVDIQWVRHSPRQHPRLSMAEVFVGDYVPLSYELEVSGVGGGAGDAGPHKFTLSTVLQPTVSTYHVKGLKFNSLYAARVRSVNVKHQTSLWSDVLRVVTLMPVVARPVQITEDSMVLEWGRDEQKDGNYLESSSATAAGVSADATAAASPLQIGSRTSAGYHLRVHRVREGGMELCMDQNFNGDVQTLELPDLLPNSAYVVAVRATNERGEWGCWSDDRCVYTMKLVRASVAAVGEDFVRLSWERGAPDEVQQASTSGTNTTTNSGAETAGDDSDDAGGEPSRFLSRAKRFTLLDRPEEAQPVYSSSRTQIQSFAISVRREDETEGYTLEVDGGVHHHTIPSLRVDTVYYIAVRARYGGGDWGPWSGSVQTSTYNLLGIELKELGEDYFAAAWQRKSNTADVQSLLLGKVEETVCYELAVHDFTDVPFGEENEAALNPRVLRSFFVQAKRRNHTVRDLLSNHRYRLCVRRWYQPLERFLGDCPPVQPATDDAQMCEMIIRMHAVPGAWSEPDLVVTLRDMVCSAEKIGEDFFCMRWERDPRAASLPTRKNFTMKLVQNYQVRIDELQHDGGSVDTGNDTYHVDQLVAPTESTFLAQGLQPDRVYRIDVRCCVEKVWGRWSRPVYLITLPKLQVDVTNIGEDCASISWSRHFRPLTLPDGAEAEIGSNDSSDKYQLDINGISFFSQLSKRFKGSRTTYTVKQLEGNALYSIQVRSCDSIRQTWSLWSEVVHFATLQPLLVNVAAPAEHFVYVDWRRPPQRAEDYGHLVDDGRTIVFGDPEVMAYHLCVFNTETTPSLAVADKQFHRDSSRYRVSALTPDTPYIVIVRACNAAGQWGLWSEERSFRTQRLLTIAVKSVGERYANVTWGHDGGDDVLQPASYVMVLKSSDGAMERTLHPSDCKISEDEGVPLPYYKLDGLTPGTQYVMALQPFYGEQDWGQWSRTARWTTLGPVVVSVQAYLDRVELTWGRKPPMFNSTAGTFDEGVGQDGAVSGAVAPRQPNAPQRPSSGKGAKRMALASPLRSDSGAADAVAATTTTTTITTAAVSTAAAGEIDDDGILKLEAGTVRRYQLIACRQEDVDAVMPKESMLGGYGGAAGDERIPDQGSRVNDGELGTAIPDMEIPDMDHESVNRFKVETEIECDNVHDRDVHFTMEQLEMDTTYVVRVRALDAYGEWGPWSEQLVDTPPYPPTAVVLRKVNAQYCSLQWGPPRSSRQGAVYRYVVEQHYVNPEGNSGGRRSNVGTDLMSAAVAGMRRATTSNVLYEWRVVDTLEGVVCPVRMLGPIARLRCRVKCCRRGDTISPYSDFSEVVALSSGTPPEPVTQLTVTSLARNNATLEWMPPVGKMSTAAAAVSTTTRGEASDAAGMSSSLIGETASRYSSLAFRVYLTHRDHPAILLTVSPFNTYTVDNLSASTEYTVQVVSENTDGISYNSPMIRFTTKDEADATPTLYEPGMSPLGTLVDASMRQDEAKDKETADIPGTNSARRSYPIITPAPPRGNKAKAGGGPYGGGRKPGGAAGTGSGGAKAADGSPVSPAAAAPEQDSRSGSLRHTPGASVHGGGGRDGKSRSKRRSASADGRKKKRKTSRRRSRNSARGEGFHAAETRPSTSSGVVLPPLSKTV